MIYRYSSGQNYSDTSNFYLQLQNLNFLLSPKKYHILFFMNIPQENPFRQLDKQLVLCLQCIIVIHIMYNRVLYMILILPRHALSYIWSWFFPVTILYMIMILPRHYLIYDPDSSPSLSYIWSWFFPATVLYMILILPRHCLIYDPDSSPSLSYIWSWFFPVSTK